MFTQRPYPMSRWAGAGVLALLVLAIVTAGACGGDDDTDAGGAGDTTEPGADDDLGGDLGSAAGAAVVEEEDDTDAVDLAIIAAAVPATAASGVDACNNPISYDGDLLTDGVVGTAWRMDGDATGRRIILTLDGSREVREVGLVPGYAKVDPCDGVDRFDQNRRVTEVTWTFDDGTSVTQTLADEPEMQWLTIDATTSTTVELYIDGVTANPERDFTAISEIGIRGT